MHESNILILLVVKKGNGQKRVKKRSKKGQKRVKKGSKKGQTRVKQGSKKGQKSGKNEIKIR